MPYGFTCKCKECKERYVGCHSVCDDYKEYRLLIEKAINNRIEVSVLTMSKGLIKLLEPTEKNVTYSI